MKVWVVPLLILDIIAQALTLGIAKMAFGVW